MKRLSLSWTTTHEWVHTASEMGYYTVQPGFIQRSQWIHTSFTVDRRIQEAIILVNYDS